MASSPTLMRDVQLIAMTSSNAHTETVAKDMLVRAYGSGLKA